MSGCGLWATAAVREACPRFIDRRLRLSSTTSAVPPLPRTRQRPDRLHSLPSATLFIHTPYLSTAVCSEQLQPYFRERCTRFHPYCYNNLRNMRRFLVYFSRMYAIQVFMSYQKFRFVDGSRQVFNSNGAIKTVYISSRATCKCYLSSLKPNYVINFMCVQCSRVIALKEIPKVC